VHDFDKKLEEGEGVFKELDLFGAKPEKMQKRLAVDLPLCFNSLMI
jgi:hypothetical protein